MFFIPILSSFFYLMDDWVFKSMYSNSDYVTFRTTENGPSPSYTVIENAHCTVYDDYNFTKVSMIQTTVVKVQLITPRPEGVVKPPSVAVKQDDLSFVFDNNC